MLEYSSFEEQLPSLCKVINRIPKISNTQITKDEYGRYQLTGEYHKQPTLKIDFLIAYNLNYQCPILHFRTFELSQEETDLGDIESWKLSFSKESLSKAIHDTTNLQMSLKQLNSETYWFVHPCDTDLVLENSSKDAFLLNWFSVYGGSSIFSLKVDELFGNTS